MPGRPGRPRDADDAASVRILLRVTPQIRGILEDIARERHMRGVPQLVRSLIADRFAHGFPDDDPDEV